MKKNEFENEISKKDRFEFGENWKSFLKDLDSNKIKAAEQSLKAMLEVETLKGKTFLDIGSGSGLFSLAARNLGAKVHSFDYDTSSVWCTNHVKERYYADDENWTVESGSILDGDYVKSLNEFDFVYSWGVLHHTGDMTSALKNAQSLVKNNGKFFIALYNKQQFASKYWLFVKRNYVKYPFMRPFWVAIHAIYPTLPHVILHKLTNRSLPRGMNYWHDLLDWLGGYPFEVATPEEIFEFGKEHGFELKRLKTVGGKTGCNEFVFERSDV